MGWKYEIIDSFHGQELLSIVSKISAAECTSKASYAEQAIEWAVRENEYRIIPNKRPPPVKRPPCFFMITNYKEIKEKFQIFRKTNAKKL